MIDETEIGTLINRLTEGNTSNYIENFKRVIYSIHDDMRENPVLLRSTTERDSPYDRDYFTHVIGEREIA
jgi:hypothetical protein